MKNVFVLAFVSCMAAAAHAGSTTCVGPLQEGHIRQAFEFSLFPYQRPLMVKTQNFRDLNICGDRVVSALSMAETESANAGYSCGIFKIEVAEGNMVLSFDQKTATLTNSQGESDLQCFTGDLSGVPQFLGADPLEQ